MKEKFFIYLQEWQIKELKILAFLMHTYIYKLFSTKMILNLSETITMERAREEPNSAQNTCYQRS